MNNSIDKINQELQKNYFALKKIMDKIKKAHATVTNDEFVENDWNEQGKDIKIDIATYKNLIKDLNKKVNYIKNEKIDNEEINNIVEKVESEIENAETNIEPLIEKINEKVSHYACDFELAAKQEIQKEEKKEEVLMDLMDNKDILQKRRKNLENIHETAAQLKEITDKMSADLSKQGELLNDTEDKVINSEEKAKKAHEEIKEANKLSKSNKKCIIFYIILICIVLAGIGLLGWGIYNYIKTNNSKNKNKNNNNNNNNNQK